MKIIRKIKLFFLTENFKLQTLNCFLCLLFVVGFRVVAENNQNIIEKANQLYQKGNYEVALKLYDKVRAGGLEAADLYYNIGNTYYKMNNIPSAILYYEKAKKLSPNDEAIIHNINITNLKTIDKIEVIPQFFILRWLNDVTDLYSTDSWAKSIIFSFVILLLSLSVFIFTRSVYIKKLSFGLILIFFIALISTFTFAQIQYSKVKENKEAIIFSPSVTVKSSPDEKSTDLFMLHEGTKVKITDKVNDWSEIRLPNGSVGWLKSNSFEVI
ncbi:MAG: tetratricopeptide repeat protein [Bacteroidales bacterium]|nr:tetratricopeptide repeat protein [Bacteroidales bacterium]